MNPQDNNQQSNPAPAIPQAPATPPADPASPAPGSAMPSAQPAAGGKSKMPLIMIGIAVVLVVIIAVVVLL